MTYTVRNLPGDSVFQTCALGLEAVQVNTMAILLGGHVRTGLEDCLHYQRGELAESTRKWSSGLCASRETWAAGRPPWRRRGRCWVSSTVEVPVVARPFCSEGIRARRFRAIVQWPRVLDSARPDAARLCRLRRRSKSGNAVLTGLLDISGWGIVAYTLVVTHLTIICVTVYLHRHQAHRALDLHPLVSHPMRFWLWLTTGMVTGSGSRCTASTTPAWSRSRIPQPAPGRHSEGLARGHRALPQGNGARGYP